MLKHFWNGWKEFARAMGGFQSRILLGLFYFLVVAPFGIPVRAFGDPLGLRRKPKSSNWIAANATADDSIKAAREQS